jgi:hypothetical protein
MLTSLLVPHRPSPCIVVAKTSSAR